VSPSPRFWNRIAGRYAKQPIADEASYQKKLESTRRRLRADMELLEIGCGTGGTAIRHAPYVKHIHAVDISSRMLALARKNARAAGVENVRFEEGAVESMDLPSENFDMVLALSILHLLEDRDTVLWKVYRCLRPGGLLISSTVCLGDFMKLFKFIGPLGRTLGIFPMVKVFTQAELETSITDTGLSIEENWRPARNKAVFIVARKHG
jgi:ubiquinone/menaquinone biosynthesis C-methylase UbiE